MFKFKKRKAEHLDYTQCVILEISLVYQERTSFFQKIVDFQETLETKMNMPYHVDGNDITDDEATIYIYGPSANVAYSLIENEVKQSDFDNVLVTLQYGRPEDAETKTKQFTA